MTAIATWTSAEATILRQIARDATYHKTGVCTRGVPGLMAATSFKRRTVQMAIRKLVEGKFIERVKWGKYTNYRVINPEVIAAAQTMLNPKRGRRVSVQEALTRVRPKPAAPVAAPRSYDPKELPRSKQDPNPKIVKIDLRDNGSKIKIRSKNQPNARARERGFSWRETMAKRYAANDWQRVNAAARAIMKIWWEHRHPGKTFSEDLERLDGSWQDWDLARQCSMIMDPMRVRQIVDEYGHKMLSLKYAYAIGEREINADRIAQGRPPVAVGEDAMGAEREFRLC